MQRKGLGSELSQKLVERLENPIIFKPLTQDLGSPAMAAGISKTLWSMDNVVALIDARAEAPKPRGSYKPRAGKIAASISN